MDHNLYDYLLHQADTHLVLGQRISEWCGHAFMLEQDIAMTNIALDLLGQARSLYQYASDLAGNKQDEDQLAFLRDEKDFKNLLLVEQPNGDFAATLMRQFLFDAYHVPLCESLALSQDQRLRGIFQKALLEARYHLTWSSEWVIRLGDGTTESHNRIAQAVESLWPWTAELFEMSSYEQELIKANVLCGPHTLKVQWEERVRSVFTEATIKVPTTPTTRSGGKIGQHTVVLAPMLAEMQTLQRQHPGLTW